MNKIKILGWIICLFFVQQSSAQAVQGKDVEVRLGLGFGLYGIGNNGPGDENDIAASGLLSLKGQYAIAKWFSLGLMLERNGYLTDPDSSENAIARNFYLSFCFRPVNKERTEVHINLDLGLGSNYSYEQEDSGEEISASGGTLQLGFGIQHFISEHIGIGYDFGLATYTYPQLENEDGDALQFYDVDKNEVVDYEVGFVGVNHRLTVAYKF